VTLSAPLAVIDQRATPRIPATTIFDERVSAELKISADIAHLAIWIESGKSEQAGCQAGQAGKRGSRAQSGGGIEGKPLRALTNRAKIREASTSGPAPGASLLPLRK